VKLEIASTWDGQPVPPSGTADVRCQMDDDALIVTVDAPFFDDPRPPGSAGSTDRLWEYEVVELFLLGVADRYLEIELGPHGHYLLLELHGTRHVVRQGLRIDHRAEIAGHRWHGHATIPLSYVPAGIARANAYLIHGTGEHRRHLAAFPVGGAAPDFHSLESFGPVAWPPGSTSRDNDG
jgi:hypothetical protein